MQDAYREKGHPLANPAERGESVTSTRSHCEGERKVVLCLGENVLVS